jgi:hypothetical protein
MNSTRLYKPRLFEILEQKLCTSPQTMTYAEFSQRVREYLVANNRIVMGEPRYLHIKVNSPAMLELTGMYGETTYPMIDNWSPLRTWDDFIRFLQARWTI